MHGKQQFQILSRLATGALTMAIVGAMMVVLTPSALCQTYEVLYAFTGGADGGNPAAGLTLDKTGNLYGTTSAGGSCCGTVFKVTHQGSGWIFKTLYSFRSGNDGSGPLARVILGADGRLYGTTSRGGNIGCYYGEGCGTVFSLNPPAGPCYTGSCAWTETVLHRFNLGVNLGEGAFPYGADLVFDQTNHLYGATPFGGPIKNQDINLGVVYELTPHHDGWAETTLHGFSGGGDGRAPYSGVIFDQAGNLYGTTIAGGAYNGGTVFQLSPSGSGWTKNILHSFQWSEGLNPVGGLIFDPSGNLYGTTTNAGPGNGGTVFMLTPSNGNWMFTVLYTFTGGPDSGPQSSLTMDTAGNLYGAIATGGTNGVGAIFKLTPSGSGWRYTSLHDFAGIGGYYPQGVVLDANGNVYGTCGNANTGWGLVFKITP